MDQREEIFVRFMNDAPFQKVVTSWMAAEAYKRLPEVLTAHAGSVRVKHTLRPLGVAMAGRDVRDPYKD